MDKEQPAPPKQAKIIDEFPTMIGSGEHDATTDFSRYELDSHFSIYKVGEDEQPEKETKEKDFDIDDPNAFLIQSDIVGGNRHYVDLDFDLNQSTKPANPIASFDPKPSIPQSTTAEETFIPKETFVKNLNDANDDSFSENLKAGQIDNFFDEKLDLIDMSASIISQSENSSFSDNVDFPSSTALNVESKPPTLDSTTSFSISSMTEDPDLSTPTISQSQSIENSTINFELSSHMELSTGLDVTAANSSSSSNNTKIETFKPEQTNLDSSTILSSSNVDFKLYSPQESKFVENVQHQDLSKMLDISENEDELISSVGHHSSVPDEDFVSESHFEPNIMQPSEEEPEEDIISKYLDTSLVPPTIPEEDFVEEVSTSFSSSVYLEKLPEALQAEPVTLPDSNHESDYDVDNSNLINSFSDISKEQSKLSDNTSSSSNANETVIVTGSAHGLSPIETITEAKTIDVQSGYVEEFVIDPSPAQQFVEEPVQLKQESLADELSWSSSSFQHRSTVEEQFHAEEAPLLAASAPILSTFALPQQKQFEMASSLDTSANVSTDPISVGSNLVQQNVDSLVASNTAPSEISAQVYTDEHYSNIFQPAAVDLKNDQSASVLVSDTVAQPVATTTSSAPMASSLSPPPSPPPSPTANITTESTQLYEEYSPFVPPQQHNQPQEQQQTQPEHEDIISATSSTNLLHTSSPANIVDQQQQQVLSALEEETEEEELLLREQEKKTWSRDNKEKEAASAPEAQEVVASKKNADTTEQWSSSSSSASTLQSAAIATTTVEPNTRPALSLSSSPAPDTSTTSSTTKMGRKNNQFRRENSNDDQDLGPDQLKEFIQGILGVNVAELVYWRDPRNTGVVFGIGLVILLSLSIFSVISVVAYTLLFTLLGTLSFRVYKNVLQAVQKTNEGHPFKEYLEVEIAPSTERINEIVEQLVSHGTCFVKRMRSVLLVEDIVDSLKYLLIFWALTYIGAWFNGLTLVILSYISAFSLPKVYELNKAQIDQYLDLVNSKLTELSDKVPFLKKVPVEKKEE